MVYYPQFHAIVKGLGEKIRSREEKTPDFPEKSAINAAAPDACTNTPFWAKSAGGHLAQFAAEELPSSKTTTTG
ncbi:MAG: hypothetical protein HQ567_32015 [Candidatus Nealsonbacteria bacterium]|nr:hypothetical protein [Candidatus Nealsonbacteria bacterium]